MVARRRAQCPARRGQAPRDLAEFVAVYEETMRRADAAPFYLFATDYWRALVRDVPLVRVDVRRDGELLAGVLGMGAPPFLHYHLGGTAEARRKQLTRAISRVSRELGLEEGEDE